MGIPGPLETFLTRAKLQGGCVNTQAKMLISMIRALGLFQGDRIGYGPLSHGPYTLTGPPLLTTQFFWPGQHHLVVIWARIGWFLMPEVFISWIRSATLLCDVLMASSWSSMSLHVLLAPAV